MIKAVVFDCFGVIITDALQVIIQELEAVNPDDARQAHDLIRANNRGIITPQESSQGIARLLGLSLAEFHDKVADGEIKDQRVLDYIVQLRSEYKTAMLSNIARPSLNQRFTPQELDGYFDVVVVSGDIGYAKPEAQAYEYVAGQLGVRLDECLFIDDREAFCEAARGVGMKAAVYESFEQGKRSIEAVLRDSRPSV